MKRLAIVFAVLFVFSVSAEAQMGEGMKPEQKGHMGHGMMGGEGKMPMMQMCMPMMQQMMGHNMMMKDTMQMMLDMMKMQKKMMKGMKTPEGKEMMMEMDKMMDRMERMMSDMRGMMMRGMMGPAPMEQKKESQPKEEKKTDPHKH